MQSGHMSLGWHGAWWSLMRRSHVWWYRGHVTYSGVMFGRHSDVWLSQDRAWPHVAAWWRHAGVSLTWDYSRLSVAWPQPLFIAANADRPRLLQALPAALPQTNRQHWPLRPPPHEAASLPKCLLVHARVSWCSHPWWRPCSSVRAGHLLRTGSLPVCARCQPWAEAA